MQKKIFVFIFFSYNLPQANHLQSKKFNFLLKFCVKILFCMYYFSPLNTFMRKEKDPEPDPHLWLMDPDLDPGGPKTCGSSVADPGCLSRIPDPDFFPSWIPDLGSKNSNKREGWKKICCHNLLCSHKFHKIENYFGFEVLKKKIWANFQRIIELFTQKIVTKL